MTSVASQPAMAAPRAEARELEIAAEWRWRSLAAVRVPANFAESDLQELEVTVGFRAREAHLSVPLGGDGEDAFLVTTCEDVRAPATLSESGLQELPRQQLIAADWQL